MDYFALERARAVAETQHDVISRQQAHACGLTNDDITSLRHCGSWRHLLRGCFFIDDSDVPEPPRLSWMHAALLTYGPRACLVGRSAAEVHDVQGLPAEPVLLVALPSGASRWHRRRTDDPPDGGTTKQGEVAVRLRQYNIRDDDVEIVAGLRVTTILRTLADTALELSRPYALSILDSAINSGRTSAQNIQRLSELCAGRPGIRRLRELIPLVDGRAESPLESRVRLACIDAGLPPDDLQYPVRDRWGQLLGFGDLAWWRGRHRPLIVEADGVDPHSLPQALFRDRHRANDFALADVDVVRFTWADTRRSLYIPVTVRRALSRPAA